MEEKFTGIYREFDGPATLTETTEQDFNGSTIEGTVVLEYKPDSRVVSASVGGELADIFRDNEEPEEDMAPVYHAIASNLYPGYDTRDEIWNYVPMVLSVTYRHSYVQSPTERHLTLGTIR